MPATATTARARTPAAAVAALLALPAGAVALVVWAVLALAGWPFVGLLVALVMGALVAWWAWARAEDAVLDVVGARPAEAARGPGEARLVNLAEGLSFASGVAVPDLYVVDDPARNALAVGRGGRRPAALVVTAGLVDGLARIELEGVLAHELAHVRRGDHAVATVAVTTAGLPLLLADRAAAGDGGIGARLLAPVLAPLAGASAGLVARACGPRREPVADLDAVAVTRYPPGLIAALEQVNTGQVAVARGARSTAHLWLAPPEGGHSLDERVQALREL